MKCSGSNLEFCGGPNRLDLYMQDLDVVLPSQPATVGDYQWFGCQTEATGVRALSAKASASGTMTLEACAAFCTGYKYFGTEYSAECKCSCIKLDV